MPDDLTPKQAAVWQALRDATRARRGSALPEEIAVCLGISGHDIDQAQLRAILRQLVGLGYAVHSHATLGAYVSTR